MIVQAACAAGVGERAACSVGGQAARGLPHSRGCVGDGAAVHGSAVRQHATAAARRSLTRAARDCARLATARGTVAYSSTSSSSARSSSACSSGLGPTIGRSGLGHVARSLSPRPRLTPRLGSRPAEDPRERACERETGCACAGHQGRTHGGRVAQDVCAASRAQSAAFAAGGTPRSPMVAGRSRSSRPSCAMRAPEASWGCAYWVRASTAVQPAGTMCGRRRTWRGHRSSRTPSRAARKCTF